MCCCCLWAGRTTVLSKLYRYTTVPRRPNSDILLYQLLEREGGHLELHQWGKLDRYFHRNNC